MTSPILITERLTLRVPNGDDTEAMLKFFQQDRSRFYGGPKDKGTAWRDFAARTGQWQLLGYGMFAIVLMETGETIGLTGPVHPGDFPEPEMSWLLTEDRFEGKGYAREACEVVLAHLFTDLGWPSVVSYIDRANAASRALALRLGATLDPASPAPIGNCDTYRHWPKGATA